MDKSQKHGIWYWKTCKLQGPFGQATVLEAIANRDVHIQSPITLVDMSLAEIITFTELIKFEIPRVLKDVAGTWRDEKPEKSQSQGWMYWNEYNLQGPFDQASVLKVVSKEIIAPHSIMSIMDMPLAILLEVAEAIACQGTKRLRGAAKTWRDAETERNIEIREEHTKIVTSSLVATHAAAAMKPKQSRAAKSKSRATHTGDTYECGKWSMSEHHSTDAGRKGGAIAEIQNDPSGTQRRKERSGEKKVTHGTRGRSLRKGRGAIAEIRVYPSITQGGMESSGQKIIIHGARGRSLRESSGKRRKSVGTQRHVQPGRSPKCP